MPKVNHKAGGGSMPEANEKAKAHNPTPNRDKNGTPKHDKGRTVGKAPSKEPVKRPLPVHQGGEGAYSKAGC